MIGKLLLFVFGGLFLLSGFVWIGQGANLLPGKLMRGDPQWILWGALLAALGAGLIYLARRRPAG